MLAIYKLLVIFAYYEVPLNGMSGQNQKIYHKDVRKLNDVQKSKMCFQLLNYVRVL